MKFSFKSMLGHLSKPEVLVDPSTFKDSLALTISWEPLSRGGSNFRTHKAVQVGANRIEFKATFLMKVFPLFFIVIPPIIVYFFVLQKYIGADKVSPDIQLVIKLIFFFIFLGLGVFLYFHFSKIFIFDRNYGYFWKGGRDKQGLVINPAEQKEAVKLSEIHALQIVHEWISGNGKGSKPFKSYELNLVLRSGERVNVVDHGNIKRLREDASGLALFLNIPLWDRTQQVCEK